MCKYCEDEALQISDDGTVCAFRIMRNEFGEYQLTTVLGRPAMKIKAVQ